MQRGGNVAAGAARVVAVRVAGGIGQWGPATTNFRLMTTYYRRLLSSNCGRRLLYTHFKPQRAKVRPPENTSGSGTNGRKDGRWNLLVLLVGRGRYLHAVEELKELTNILRMVVRQCEVQTAERIRRGLQLYSVYSRLWGEEAALALFNNLRRMLVARGRSLLLSAVCFSKYDWETNKISNERLKGAMRDLESVEELCKATVQCQDCGKRQVIDQQMSNVEYCMCEGQLGYTDTSRVYDSWEPFIERKHHVVWRKRHEVHQHLYAYKVYGAYDDVSLSAFMEVHLNSDFRTEWDDTALQLRVLESHKESNSDLIYWLVKYPHFFANRDYIFKRRFLWNEAKQEVVIMSEAVSPDHVPEEKGIHRVNEYWSVMVIKAKEDANQPGLEYTLTYFDNPGTSLPQWLTNFIAVTGFPSYLQKLHGAALNLQAIHEKGKDVYVSLPDELRYPRPTLKIPTLQDFPERETSAKEDTTLTVEESLKRTIIQTESVLLSDEKSVKKGADSVRGVSRESVRNIKSSEHIKEGSSDKDWETEIATELNKNVVKHVKINTSGDDRGLSSENVLESKMQMGGTDVENDTSSAMDKLLHVRWGTKNVAVDILEAMEVVAPDLDTLTLLSKNVEKLTVKALEELENKTEIIEALEKLKKKLKRFQEHASQKKESSLKEMRELEERSHYDHFDVQTQKHLEKLFQAMREVLRADKDMRTGKDLLEKSSGNGENEIYNKTKFDIRRPFQSSSTVTKITSREAPLSAKASDSLNRKNSKEKEGKRKPKLPDDSSPPPSPPAPSSGASEIDEKAGDNGETTSNEIKTYNGISSVDSSLQNSKKLEKSWIYIPYLTEWWRSEKSVQSVENPHVSNGIMQTDNVSEESVKLHKDVSTHSVAAQVWYVVGLGWIFGTKSEVCSDSGQQSEESVSSRYPNADREESYTWYWYPVYGPYRLYAWVFKSSKASM